MTKPSHNRNDLVLRREVAAIRRLKKSAASHGKAFLADIVQIGKRLSRVKDRVGHGNWLTWLRKNFDWSGDTAANYINVFELSKTPEFRRLRNLPLELLYLLGRRNVSPEARIAIMERVEAGEKVTAQKVRLYSAPQELRPSPPQERQEVNLCPPEAASTTRPNPLTAEDLQAGHRRNLVDLVVEFASKLPRDQSFEEASAVVESIGTEGMRERFSEAVAKLDEFVDQLQRVLNERLIEVPAPALRVIPGKDD